MQDAADKAREAMVEQVVETDDALMHRYLEEHDITARRDADRAARARRIADEGRAGPLRRGAAQQGRAAAARRGRRTTCPRRSTFRRSRASNPKTGEELRARARRRRAVQRARLQDRRPTRSSDSSPSSGSTRAS